MNLELIKELKQECQREASLRKNVYPKLVASGQKSDEEAKRQIYLMQLAAACFDKIIQGKAPEVQQTLFNTGEFQTHKSMYEHGY